MLCSDEMMPRTRTFLTTIVAGLAGVLCLAGAGAAEASAASAPASDPPPTSTPSAPGIAIAQAKFDLPDPFLMTDGPRYYLFLSTAFGTHDVNVPRLTGTPDHFAHMSDALPSLPSWALPAAAGGLTWAPEIARFGNHYVMYFASTLKGSLPVQHCIGEATAPSPRVTFKPLPQPFICQRNEGGDIDAQVFRDPQGPQGASHPYYLVWKSDNNSTPGTGVPTIWAAPLSNTGLALTGPPTEIYQPDQSWQYSLIEAPQMVRSPDGRIWLFYSAGQGFFSPNYGMGYASCLGPLGPCTDDGNGPLITSNAQGPGPGEETIYTASDGSVWMLYSPWYQQKAFDWIRPVEASRIGFNANGPYVAQAGTFPSPA
jgi:hypothetical protein